MKIGSSYIHRLVHPPRMARGQKRTDRDRAQDGGGTFKIVAQIREGVDRS